MKTIMRSGIIFAAALATSAAWAATKTTEVEGVAAVVNNDIAMARDKAIDDAKRKAVEQIAGTHVSAQSITENFQLVEDRVYSKASGFVRNYKILSEFKDEGVYRVKINATVDDKAIADNLSMIFKTKPRVIVMIAEQNIGSKGFSYWWGSSGYVSNMDLMQTTLISKWQPLGFKFVDPGMLSDKLQVRGAMRKPELNNKAALSIGRSADADVAIVGKVLVTDAGPVMKDMKMHSYHAVGTLRIINVDTGEIIAVADDTGVGQHITPNIGGRAAIKGLAAKIADKLQKQIMAKWTAEAASARSLELVVNGVRNTKMLKAMTKVIREEVRGVESAKIRRRRGKKAYLSIRVRATANEFGQDLESKKYQGFKLELVDVSKARLKVSLVQ